VLFVAEPPLTQAASIRLGVFSCATHASWGSRRTAPTRWSPSRLGGRV